MAAATVLNNQIIAISRQRCVSASCASGTQGRYFERLTWPRPATDRAATRTLPGRQRPTENNAELRAVFRDGVSRVPRKKIPP